jgi:predicted transcriptional regulator of viral defense system
MNFRALLDLVAGEPVFCSGLLMGGAGSRAQVHLQLSRWVKAGKLIQLRRGLYALAKPYARELPHPFLVANRLCEASYVSLQSALAWYGMIPEFVPVVTSVTSGRPRECRTALGDFLFRHVRAPEFRGYRRVEVQQGQFAFVASPEKCLLDLIHLTAGADARSYLRELRLQNLTQLDPDSLLDMAAEWDRPKVLRAAERITELREEEL